MIDIHCVRRRRQQPTYLVPFKRNKAASYFGRACFERAARDGENAWPRPNRKRSSSSPVAYVVERIFRQQKVFCSALVRPHETAIGQTGVSILSCDRASTWLQNDIYDASRCARTYQVFVRVNASSMWKPTCVVMQPTCIANRIGRGSGKEARRSDPLRAPSPPRTYGEYSVAYGRVKRKPHDGLRQVVTRYRTVVTTTPKPLSRCEYSYELECILLKIRPTGWHCNLVDNWAHNLDLSLVTVQNVAPLLSLTS